MTEQKHGPKSHTVSRRPGTDPFGDQGWRGPNTESDPASLNPNELLRGENVRLKGKNIINRAGLEQKIDLSTYSGRTGGAPGAAGAIMWMRDCPNELRTRLWLAALGCLSAVDLGFQIYHIDPTQSPTVQKYIEIVTTANRFVPIGSYGDLLYAGDSSLLKTVQLVTAPFGISAATVLGLTKPIFEVKEFDGYTIRCMRETPDGKFAIGMENNTDPANSKIVIYDGAEYVDDLTGIRPPLAFGIFQDKLVCGFDATAANIRVRDIGSAPGTWTTVALAGFQCTVNQNAMQERGPYLYIASGAADIFRFDGSSLTLERTIAGCDMTGDGVTALCLYDNLLHYGWNAAATFNSRIGRHDSDSTAANEWTDTYLDITAQQASFTGLTSMASYRRRIYVGGRAATFLATAVNDVKGTMKVINTGTASAGFRARQMLVFPVGAIV